VPKTVREAYVGMVIFIILHCAFSWQVAYVWAFLIRFRRDHIPAEAERFEKQNVITELRTVDE